MSYGVKYRTTYKRRSNNTTTIDILKKSYSGSITNLVADDNPLEITTQGNAENIYQPTIGTGAVIRVLTNTSLISDLYTEDPQLFMVKIYNGASGSNLIWQGFVSPEIYHENYSLSTNIPIEITCNDGMQVLEYLNYAQTGDTYYTGTTNLSTIFGNILNKLAITFDKIYYVTDYRIADYGRNIFLHLYMAQENFVDESGVPMTCRKVLESIAGGLGMVIKFKGTNIYFYDPIDLNNVSIGHEYGITPVVGYDADIPADFGGVLDLSASTFNWFETGASLDIIPSYNEVQVKYNPYNFSEYTYDFDNSDNWSTEGSFSSFVGGGSTYYRNEDVIFKGWTRTGISSNEIGVKETINDSPIYGFFLSNWGITYTLGYVFPFSNVTMDKYSGSLQLKITADIYVQTKANTWNIFCSGTSHQIYELEIPVSVKVGNKYFHNNGTWTTGFTSSTDYLPLVVRQEGISATDYTKSNVSDTWTTASMLVRLTPNSSHTGYDELIQGNIEIKIADDLKTYFSQQVRPSTNAQYLYKIMLKNFKVEVIDTKTGKITGNDGVSTKVIISPNLTGKSPLKIDTTSGIGTYGNSRGAFKTDLQVNVGTNAVGLIRSTAETGGTAYNTSKLILQSIISQYKQPRYKLTGTLDVQNYLNDIDLYLIRDSKHQPNKTFYIIGGTYNDSNESYNAELLELVSSRDCIV